MGVSVLPFSFVQSICVYVFFKLLVISCFKVVDHIVSLEIKWGQKQKSPRNIRLTDTQIEIEYNNTVANNAKIIVLLIE